MRAAAAERQMVAALLDALSPYKTSLALAPQESVASTLTRFGSASLAPELEADAGAPGAPSTRPCTHALSPAWPPNPCPTQALLECACSSCSRPRAVRALPRTRRRGCAAAQEATMPGCSWYA